MFRSNGTITLQRRRVVVPRLVLWMMMIMLLLSTTMFVAAHDEDDDDDDNIDHIDKSSSNTTEKNEVHPPHPSLHSHPHPPKPSSSSSSFSSSSYKDFNYTHLTASGELHHKETKKDWYTRETIYPEYCSTTDQMLRRSIPSLPTDDTRIGETRLVHVSAILRHGARTINQPPKDTHCWDGYWESPETGIWDCDLTSILTPPTPEHVKEEEGTKLQTAATAMFLFDKHFDALQQQQQQEHQQGKDYSSGGGTSKGYYSSNALNGTCQLGQLLLQGYDQQLTNGKFLRNAYLYESGTYNHDERMRLFDLSTTTATNSKITPPKKPTIQIDPWDERNIYLRADDDEKTLMSGQLLLRGLFGPELRKSSQYDKAPFPTIPIHTADRTRDIVGGIGYECPKLQALKQKAESSKTYRDFYNSLESQKVRHFMEHTLTTTTNDGAKGVEDGIFDCLMTSLCTDRPIPHQSAILDEWPTTPAAPETWLSRIETYHAKNHSFHLRYNDAAYSKVNMGPLWVEIMDHILPVINDDEEEDRGRPPAKLAIYSGHDSTLMGLMTSLGRHIWNGTEPISYASMMLIEIHEFIDDQSDSSIYQSQHAFRLIYNGKVLTSLMEGCPQDSELCDAQVLIQHVQPFATRSVNCWDGFTGRDKNTSMIWHTIKSLLSKTGGVILLFCIMAISAVIGGATMFLYLTGTLPDAQSAIKVVQDHRIGKQMEGDNNSNNHFFGRSELDGDREGRVGLMDEIEMTFTDASLPFDEK